MEEEDVVALGLYFAGLMDAHRVQSKQVAIVSGEAPETVSRFKTGSRSVNRKQFCQMMIALGRCIERREETAHKISQNVRRAA